MNLIIKINPDNAAFEDGLAHWQEIHICSWCMPQNIPGSHGICKRCLKMVWADFATEGLGQAIAYEMRRGSL